MKRRELLLLVAMLATVACGRRPPVDSEVLPPTGIVDFNFLYARNCAGCHGADGKGGAAVSLGDPVYLAIAGDDTIRHVTAGGVPGTTMPAFAQHSGGMLTDSQINVIIAGIRTHWAKPDALGGANPPPYSAQAPGDPKHGAAAFAIYCSSCHGADGRGSKRASSIVNASYLALVSDQNLRTTVIVGKPELGAPDWRGDLPDRPMSPEDVSDVVAWLSAQRPQFLGQPNPSALLLKGGTR